MLTIPLYLFPPEQHSWDKKIRWKYLGCFPTERKFNKPKAKFTNGSKENDLFSTSQVLGSRTSVHTVMMNAFPLTSCLSLSFYCWATAIWNIPSLCLGHLSWLCLLPKSWPPLACWGEGDVGGTALVLCHWVISLFVAWTPSTALWGLLWGKLNPSQPAQAEAQLLSEYPACCFIRALPLVSMILLLPEHSP